MARLYLISIQQHTLPGHSKQEARNQILPSIMNIILKPLRFIPFRKSDIVKMCLEKGDLDHSEHSHFRKFYQLLHSTFHFEFHQTLEQLKDAYATINPDADTHTLNLVSDKEKSSRFIDQLNSLLDKANYERVSNDDLQQALKEQSLFKIRLQVDFSEFEEVSLFCRGQSVRSETMVSWFGLHKRQISFTNYDRVVVYIRFRDDYEPADKRLPACKPGATLLKLFQNVPKADLEMLFPNTRIRMRTLDKLMIGVPAAISGGIVVTTKLGTTLVLMGSLIGFWIGVHHDPVELNKTTILALLAGLGALAAYLWKQFNNFKNRKLHFMQTLTQNLYFKNLDNNAGVFYRVLNDAEEEECKEAILAYYFLLTASTALSVDELDSLIELWFANQWQTQLDFEVEDALQKLERLGLVVPDDHRYTAVPLNEAIYLLDQQWDAFFSAS